MARKKRASRKKTTRKSSRKVKVTWKKWEAPPRSIRPKLPDSYFLMPKKNLFPYKEWKGPLKGAINCNALKVAIAYAGFTNRPKIKKKAQMLYNRYCKR